MPRSKASGIPSEFKLPAYEICESWGLSEWYFALSKRSLLRKDWHLACLDGKCNFVPEKMIADNKAAALRLFAEPLGDESVSFSTESCTSTIRNQTVADFFEGHTCFTDPDYEYWADRFELSGLLPDNDTTLCQHGVFDAELTEIARNGSEVCSRLAAWEMHKKVNEFSGPFFVAVDLGASDDFLLREFRVWLRNIRKAARVYPVRRVVDDSDLKRWHQQRLLPYLDLDYWATIHGKRFTLPSYSLALFPHRHFGDVEDMVRRTIRPRALKIISDEYLSAMRLQVQMSKSHESAS